jgi:hypothetical protein
LSKGAWKKGRKTLSPTQTGKEVTTDKTLPEKTPLVKASTSGKEIIPGAIISAQKAEEEKKKTSPPEGEGEVIDLTDDELRDLLSILFQEGGNVALRFLKRQLIEEKEGATFGKLSLPYFRAKLKEKVNLGLTGPLIYALLVVVSKPLTPEGEKLKAEKAFAQKKAAEYQGQVTLAKEQEKK